MQTATQETKSTTASKQEQVYVKKNAKCIFCNESNATLTSEKVNFVFRQDVHNISNYNYRCSTCSRTFQSVEARQAVLTQLYEKYDDLKPTLKTIIFE